MKENESTKNFTALKIALFVTVLLIGYEFLEHWDDFKAGLRGDPALPARASH